jgi:hypothetical protein
MFVKLSNWLASIAKGWLVLVFFIIDAIFMVVVMPLAQGQLEKFSNGVGPIDLTFFPSAEKVISSVVAYGEEGRAFYTTVELTADILYPIAYTFFFSLLISFVFQRVIDKNSKLQRLNLLPFGAWVFDMLENICILLILASYPSQEIGIAGILTFANGIKWLFAGASLLALLYGVGIWLLAKTKKG